MAAISDSERIHRQIKSRLLALPPRAFELFAGDLLEYIGMRDISVTRYSSDGGIDAIGTLETGNALISIPAGIQFKRYRANVQRPDIDRFIGALSGHYSQGIFITTSSYSPQAAFKASNSIPRIATVDGDQVVRLMLQKQLGITDGSTAPAMLDEQYFQQFEAQANLRSHRITEQPEIYQVHNEREPLATITARPEDDLISLRALSHALRVDTTGLRRLIEQGKLQSDTPESPIRNGYFFRRDRIESLRTTLLLGKARPADPDTWRQEFLDFARSRNLTKSYKPVLLKALLKIVDRNGEAKLDLLATEFRAFYLARHQAGLIVEYGPPDLSDTQAVSDTQLRQLIIRHPLERFLIKGFLEYQPDEGIVRFATQLWSELRYWELLDIQRSADEQIAYYYQRSR
jgi:hypothetical protein